jgi:hypothetical protein
MNYVIFNIVLLSCLSAALINPDQVKSSMQYVDENWEGIAQAGYKRIFGAQTLPLEKIDGLTRALGKF